MKELPKPFDMATVDSATELIRGWIIDGKLQCSLYPGIFEDNPETWGILLSDVARHVASAIEKEKGVDKEKVLSLIWKSLNDSWNDSWERYDGDFVEWPQVSETKNPRTNQ